MITPKPTTSNEKNKNIAKPSIPNSKRPTTFNSINTPNPRSVQKLNNNLNLSNQNTINQIEQSQRKYLSNIKSRHEKLRDNSNMYTSYNSYSYQQTESKNSDSSECAKEPIRIKKSLTNRNDKKGIQNRSMSTSK